MAKTRKRRRKQGGSWGLLLALLLGLFYYYFMGDKEAQKAPRHESQGGRPPMQEQAERPLPEHREKLTADFAPEHPKDFDAAKRILRELFSAGEEFYCACSYDFAKKQVLDVQACGFKAHSSRGRRIEWEHVVPASVFGRRFSAWTDGDPACQRDGQLQRGRNCAREVSEVFRMMEADLYNLLPAVGELNRARANFAFGEVAGESRAFGACDFEVQREVVEPRPSIRGDIARIYFYMDSRYPNFGILKPEQIPLFTEWDQADPIDAQERARLKAIENVQGNSFFIGRLSQKAESKARKSQF